MAEYKVGMIDLDPPREWNGPKGKVYYITVGLEGHSKPVTIGKKTPDAIKVGDTVHGDIIPTDYTTDKWKHGEPPQSSSSSTGKDNAYLKDTSDIPIRLIIELLKYYDVQSLYNSPQYTQMIKLAQSLNDDAVIMIEGNRKGNLPKVNEAEVSQTQVKPSLADRWEQATNTKATTLDDAPPHGDEDVPYDN